MYGDILPNSGLLKRITYFLMNYREYCIYPYVIKVEIKCPFLPVYSYTGHFEISEILMSAISLEKNIVVGTNVHIIIFGISKNRTLKHEIRLKFKA